MALIETIKRNAKVLGSVAAFVASIVGAAFTIDARYAKASDLETLQKQQETYANAFRKEQQMSIDRLRKQQLEDKLFELRLNPHPTQTDRALIRRYEDQLNEVTNRLSPR